MSTQTDEKCTLLNAAFCLEEAERYLKGTRARYHLPLDSYIVLLRQWAEELKVETPVRSGETRRV